MKKWSLAFQSLECGRCSAVRQRALPCPECGATPDEREVDQYLTRRRRVVERARRIATAPDSQRVDAAPLEDIQAQAVRALNALLRGIDAVLSPEDEKTAAAELGQSLAMIARLRSQLSATPRRRPFTAVWDGTDHALAHLDSAAELFVQALSEAVMGDAQRVADEAQQHLDAATGPLDSASEALDDLAAALAGSSAQLVGFLAHRTSMRSTPGGEGKQSDAFVAFAEEAARSDERLQHLLRFEDERARLMFDRHRFWRLAGETYQQLRDSPEFGRLLANDAWRRHFLLASDQLADVAVAAEAMATAAYQERHLVRADLDSIKTLFEGPAKTLLRTRLCLHRRRPFDQIKGDAAAILDQAKQAGMEAATLGFRKDLRHAISHERFDVDHGTVILHAGQPRELRIERGELVNEVLAALESTLAMHSAISVLLWHLDEQLADEAARRAISPEQAIWLCFRLLAHEISSVTLEGDTIHVALSTPFHSRTLTAIAGLAWLLPDGSETLVLLSEADGRLVGPLAPFRRLASETDEWERDLQLWEVLTTWRWNDAPVAGPALWRCWVASMAVRTQEDEPREAIAKLRDLRSFATKLNDRALVELTNDVLRFHQHRLTRLPMADTDINRMMTRLREWGTRPERWPRLMPGD